MVPDHLKSILVDDWEYVTKNLSLVPLPSPHPVNQILDTYFDEEKGKRRLGSAEADLLEEVVMGMKDYFENCLGRILLYRFERQQYLEVKKGMEKGTGDFAGKKGVGDVYGPEHLCRLFGMFQFSFLLGNLSCDLCIPAHSSDPPRAHCPNKHGRPVCPQAERRGREGDELAGEKLYQVLCRGV